MTSINGRPNGGRDVIKSVARALDVLLELAQDGGISSIASLSEHTGLPSPTVFRILQTLAARGFAIRTARGEYSVGAASFTLTSAAGESMGAAMHESLRKLSEKTGESVSMAMYDDGSALYIAHQSSAQSMRQFTRAGNRVSLHATGVGKVLLAAMNEADRARIIAGMDMVPLTSHTLTDPAVLAAECDRIRQTGYAIDDEEQEIGVRCVAMGVPEYPLFAVSVSGPPSRMSDSRIRQIVIPGLTRTVGQISETLSSTS